MMPPRPLGIGLSVGGLALALALGTSTPRVQANVYASNVRINGGITNRAIAQGTGVTISYILNEPASAGVTIRFLSGATAQRTINLPGGGAGTTRGPNFVIWDGTADGGLTMPAGTYAVSITAAAAGNERWMKLTDDNNPGNYVWESRGIAVNRNTNSPYYGRVFVGNAYPGPSGQYGDQVGIVKLNADGSDADEGPFSTGGIAWPGNYQAPWKIRISEDDYVYIEDWTEAGDIYRFDGTISSASALKVLSPPTDKSQGNWSGFCITGRGTNTVLWATDAIYPGSYGINKMPVKPDGTFNAAARTIVVDIGGSPGLSYYPYAVAVDKSGAIYTLQNGETAGDSFARVFRFPAYDPSTNGGAPEFNATWTAGPGNDYCGGHGIAVNPAGTYVAACFWGYNIPATSFWTNGNIKIFNAASGTLATNLDLGLSYPNSITDDPLHHIDTDCDWDAVGNLYYLDNYGGCWRAFSPPGANQSTTVALANLQITGSASPATLKIVRGSGSNLTISYSSGAAAQYVLLSSPTVNAPLSGWTRVATNTASADSFNITATTRAFYCVKGE